MTANTGRRGGRWRKLWANQRAKCLPCCLCGQPIDYTLRWPNPESFSVQHLKSWIAHPELREDPTNLGSAHLGCNTAQGDSTELKTGTTTEAW